MKHCHPTAWLAAMLVVALAQPAATTTAGFDLGLDELFTVTAPPWNVAGGFIPPETQARAGMNPAPTTAGEAAAAPSSEAVNRQVQKSGVDIGLYPTAGVYTPPRAFPARVPGNFAAMVKMPLVWDGRDWRRLGLGVAAVGAVALLDDEINGWFDRHRSDDVVQAAETIRPSARRVRCSCSGRPGSRGATSTDPSSSPPSASTLPRRSTQTATASRFT